ncbi:hypothetical protein BC829DRAFT_383028 [Chytridium lagenaria]|nr:hypothetical protein BC829DRAFT_383028 [Chytridium lagenaria]
MPEAQYYLGKAYAEDDKCCLPVLCKSAKSSHPSACYAVGSCLENGKGCKADAKAAGPMYRKAALLSHRLAMYRYGLAVLNGDLSIPPNPLEGLKWLKKCAALADKDHPHALLQLAIIYEKGLPPYVKEDHFHALSLLREAVQFDYGPAISRLAMVYETGKLGLPVDIRKPLSFTNEGRYMHSSDFIFVVYRIFCPENMEQALYWAEKSAARGHADSQYALGYFFEHGIGTIINMETAIFWYKKAAENESQRALEWLACHPERKSGSADKCVIS